MVEATTVSGCEMSSYLRIRCFGRFQVDNGTPVALPRHSAALLALLATTDAPIERSWAADLLWDGPSLSNKRHSLSQVLYAVRKVVPCGVSSTFRHASLGPNTTRDTLAFATAINARQYHTALDLYDGPFLDRFPYITDAFDDWRIGKAAAYEEDAIAACTAILSRCAAVEDHRSVADAAKRALLIRPFDETFARARVEALASMGDSVRALRELDSYRKRIAIETGSYPNTLSDSFAESITRLPLALSPTSPSGAPTRFVGRTSELSAINAHLRASPIGSQVVLIEGEPGIGKTRLLQHSLRRVAIEGTRIFMYTCAESEHRLPHSGIVGLIRDGFRRQDLDALDEVWRSVLCELLPELFGGDKNSAHQPHILWEASARYFGSAARHGPVAIAVDDLQWLDDSSLSVIKYVLKRLPDVRLLFVGAGRPPLHSPAFEDDQSSTLRVNLKELSPTAIEELISDFERVNQMEVNPATRLALHRRIGGRPFFILQALSHLHIHGGNFTDQDTLPPNVTRYVTRRLSTLSPNARDIAEAMAVLNRAAPVHLLAAATEHSVLAVARGLDELMAQGIVADQPTPRFSHDLIRQAVLSSLPEHKISAWHALIGNAFSIHSHATPGVAAYHYEFAGDRDKAFRHALEAAGAAYRSAEYHVSSDHYARAVRCAPADKKTDVQAKYLLVLAKLGNFEPLYPHLDVLEAHYQSAGDDAGLSVCLLAKFTREEAVGTSDIASSVARAKDIIARTERHFPSQIASVLWQVADTIRRSGELGLLAQFAKLLQLQAKTASIANRVEMLSAASLLGAVSIGLSYGRPLAEEACQVSDQLPEGILTVRTLYARGTLMLRAGELKRAAADFERALNIASGHLVGQLLSGIKSNYSIVLVEQGDFSAAEQMAIESLREAGAPRRGYAFGNLATINLRCGNWPGVKHYAYALLESNETTPHAWIPAHVEALLGLAELGAGNTEAAIRHAGLMDEMRPPFDPLVDNSHLIILSARVDIARNKLESAISKLERAIVSTSDHDALSSCRMGIELARVLALAGRPHESSQLLDEVILRTQSGAMLCLMHEAADVTTAS